VNAPAHVVFNALVLGRGPWQRAWLPITAGALAPDLPMVAFYVYQRAVLGAPESVIWTHAYFEPEWQLLFNWFHSLPLLALAALIAWRTGAIGWLAFFSSMLLHSLTDLPVHHDDAHAHFLPFSSWRFESPISYWDPRHHGHVLGVLETLLILAGATALATGSRTRPWRILGMVTLVFSALLAVFAAIAWGSGQRGIDS
jgi:hypothetical protein